MTTPRCYLDANALVACVVNVTEQDRTAQMRRFLKSKPHLDISPLAEYEARKHLHQAGPAEWEKELNGFLRGRLLGDQWSAAILQAVKMARDFKARLAVDSADTLHVGWALAVGADLFVSFDRKSGPRSLALCLGLKVWPEPTEADWTQMRRLKA